MISLGKGDAVFVVDVQNDFCPGGALPIEQGDDVVPEINRWLDAAKAAGVPVYASRDWHPETHLSFEPFGGPWPVHCVQDTPGAAFHSDLRLGSDAIVVTKGTRFDKDQYSAFDDTGLAKELRRNNVSRLWIGGLALDVCVRATVLDAVASGFEVRLIAAACKPVTPKGGEDALAEMKASGANIEM